jgi:putative ATP-dependent endonuclease of the OLD family
LRIEKIEIKNLRALKHAEVHFDDYTSLIGPNGAGKSTILCALNIFFREIENSSTNLLDLDKEDFHHQNTDEPIEITVTFKDLSPEAQNDFAGYFRQGRLIVTAKAEFETTSGKASVKQFGQRLAMPQFAEFFAQLNDGAKVGDLQREFQRIRTAMTEVAQAATKDAMKAALREYEEAHPEQCQPIPSADQFYGVSKGENRLAKYVQWVYVPAVKDTLKENVDAKNTALGRLIARTVRAKVNFADKIARLQEKTLETYRTLIGEQQGALDELSQSLTKRLGQWAHPAASARLEWTDDPKKSVQVDEPIARAIAGESGFMGELARFGHGLQRSYLLALLQELAESQDNSAPRLLLGCEEPELYQHPPQAKHLASVLVDLSQGNAQVIVSTHSPHFVSGAAFESVRLVRPDTAARCSRVSQVTFASVAAKMAEVKDEAVTSLPAQRAKLHQALQPHLNEMFFARTLILVEGLEDVAYLTSWMVLQGMWDDFRRHGCHLVPANGKGYLVEPLYIAMALGIPTFVMFDADGNRPNLNERGKHEKDNRALLRLLGRGTEDPFPAAPLWGPNFVVWPHNFGVTLKSEIGTQAWDRTFGVANRELGNPEGSYAKNPVHIGEHLEILAAEGVTPASLDQVCRQIITFATTGAVLTTSGVAA